VPRALGDYTFNVMTSVEQLTVGETRIRSTAPHLKSVLKRSTSFGPNSSDLRDKPRRRASFSDDHGADLCSIYPIPSLHLRSNTIEEEELSACCNIS